MYKEFIKNILSLSKSVNFKLTILANHINDRLLESGYQVDLNNKYSWKYYMNISGEKHSTNRNISIKLVETGEEVLYSKEVLDNNQFTKKELLKMGTFYKELVNTYPDEILYIKGCLFTCDKNEAINSEDGTILSYNITLLETSESIIIDDLETYLKKILYRWMLKEYSKNENLYTPSLLAVIYNNIPTFILNKRINNINTPYVHSFFVNEYFKSNGIGNSITFLSRQSKFWLYRNLDYIKHNIGKDKVLKSMIDNIFTPNNVGIAKLDISKYVEVGDEVQTKAVVTADAYNALYDNNNEITISEVLEKELLSVDALHGLSDKYLENFDSELEIVNNTLNLLKQNQESTKIIYIQPKNMYEFTTTKLEAVIYNWLYMVKNGIYNNSLTYNDPNNSNDDKSGMRLGSVSEYSDPNTNKTYNINSYSGFLMVLKILLKITGKENMVLGGINYYGIISASIDVDKIGMFEDGYSNELIKNLNNEAPLVPTMISNSESFNSYMESYFNYSKKIKIIASNTSNSFVSGNIKCFSKSITTNGVFSEISGKTIDEALLDANIVYEISDSYDLISSLRSLLEYFTGYIDTKVLINLEVESYKNLLNKLTSYTTQVITDKNTDIDLSLYENGQKLFISKQALISILDYSVCPLEKIVYELHSYIDDFVGFAKVYLNPSRPKVCEYIAMEGKFIIYKPHSLLKNIPINFIRVRHDCYDVLHRNWVEEFIKNLKLEVMPLEYNNSSLLNDNDENSFDKVTINNVDTISVENEQQEVGSNVINKISGIQRPTNIITIK